MFVAGSATAPMLITSLSLAQRLVPAALVTEGMAVAITGILIGISGGSAVGGWAIEAWGAQQAYAVPVLAGGLALAIIAARYRHLERHELREPVSSQAPARMTAPTSRSSSRWTRSARRPGSIAPTSASPSSRAGVAVAASTTSSKRQPGGLHGVAHGAVHGQGAAGDRAVRRQPGHPVAHLHRGRAEHVVAVRGAGGAHRVGDEEEAVRGRVAAQCSTAGCRCTPSAISSTHARGPRRAPTPARARGGGSGASR